jgi:AcrR family transcriptional regulator
VAAPRRDEILEATVELIERDGLENFSMRALAKEIGNAPMAVYRHFSCRQELLEQAADRLLAGAHIPGPDEGPWDVRMRKMALSIWKSVTAHPWVHLVLDTSSMREPQIRQTRALHGMLREAGLAGSDLPNAAALFWSAMTGYIKAPYTTGRDRPAARRRQREFEFGMDRIIESFAAYGASARQGAGAARKRSDTSR